MSLFPSLPPSLSQTKAFPSLKLNRPYMSDKIIYPFARYVKNTERDCTQA